MPAKAAPAQVSKHGNDTMKSEEDESRWFPANLVRLPGRIGQDWAIDVEKALPEGEYFVYAVVTAETAAIPRANGKHSRLLYVGMGYRNRPRSLIQGSHSASHALDQLRRAVTGAGKLAVELWLAKAGNAALQEVNILNRCAQHYGELPPANRKWEGYLSQVDHRSS